MNQKPEKGSQSGRRVSKLPRPVKGLNEDQFFYIKGDINSLNVDYPFPSKHYTEKQEAVKLVRSIYFTWIVAIVVGVLTGFLYVILLLTVEEIVSLRVFCFNLCSGGDNSLCVVFALNWPFVCWIASILSSVIVIWIEPGAEGNGVPETGCYLNGVEVPRYDRWTVIPVRIISTLLMVIGAMPGGLEEPLLPIGCIIGILISEIRIPYKPFAFLNSFNNDQFKRKAVTMGLGASASAAFGTPVGGSVFALELLSHWHSNVPLITIVSAFCSAFTSNYIYTIFRDMNVVGTETFSFFAPFKPEKVDYNLQEIPLFVLMGVIGGLLGALWNAIHVQLCRFRIRFIQKNWIKFIEAVIVSSIVVTTSSVTFLYFNDSKMVCRPKNITFKDYFIFGDVDQLKGPCDEGQIPPEAIFLLLQPKSLFRSLIVLPEEAIDEHHLIAAFFLFFAWSCIHLGTYMPSGIIIPHLVIGALWGRLFKTYIVDSLIEEETQLSKFSYLAAAAQVSGVTRLSFGLGVMMIEAAGSVNFCLPVFIVIFCAGYVGSIFNSSIYEIRSYCQGYPALSPHPPPLGLALTARDVLARRIVALPQVMTVGIIKSVLNNYQHMEFPVLDIENVLDTESGNPQTPSIKGTILRKQLIALIRPDRNSSILGLHYERKTPLATIPDTTEINLGRQMNSAPFYVIETMPLSRVHAVFTSLKLHHLLVVNDKFQMVGLISRKDIAMIHLQSNYFMKKVTLRNVVYFKVQ